MDAGEDASDEADGDEMGGEASKRSWTSTASDVASAGISPRVASTGEVVGSLDLEVADLGGGGRMEGRRGFGRRTGGVNC